MAAHRWGAGSSPFVRAAKPDGRDQGRVAGNSHAHGDVGVAHGGVGRGRTYNAAGGGFGLFFFLFARSASRHSLCAGEFW
jgi:hypothetical protein